MIRTVVAAPETKTGWGFGRFVNVKAVDEAQHKTCFGCHEANVHDLVFTRLAL
jgi:hypothetical protein